VVQVATGKAHSLFLTAEGEVLACGSNSAGQCGVGKGKDNITTPQQISYAGPNIVQVSSLSC
jgi:alpha-tubulin suppressor-like RCC1 family protein